MPKLNYSLCSLLIHNVPLILIFAGFRIRESHLTLAGEMFLTVDALSLTMKINEISCTDNDLCNVQNNAQQREQVPPNILHSRSVVRKPINVNSSLSKKVKNERKKIVLKSFHWLVIKLE